MAGQLPLYRFGQIQCQVKSIGNLLGLGRTASCTIGVYTMTVTADQLDLQVLGKPRR